MRPRPAPAGAVKHYRRWTPREDERLRLAWGDGSLETVAAELGRSTITTYWRARCLGLTGGPPQGMEYLHAAAKRAGFTTGQLRELLNKAKIRIHQAFARPRRPGESKTGRTYHYVDPDAVDRVVAGWNRTELVHPAAIRRGLCGDTLRRWLEAAGHRPPAGKKARWRVPTATIDAVVAIHRGLLSVRAHAARLGIDRNTLAKKLRAAGVLDAKRPGVEVQLRADVVDAALAAHPVRRLRHRTG